MDIETIHLLGFALAPVFVIGSFVYYKDKHEREPIPILLKCFILGVFSIFPAILFSTVFGFFGWGISSNLITTALFAWIGVGFSEEFAKYIFLKGYAYKHKEFNEPYDGIVYSLMIGLGFAAAENLMYVFGEESYQAGLTVAYIRAFTAVPAHATFAILMGYYAGLEKFSTEQSGVYLVKGLFWAVFFHGAYDYFLFTSNYLGMGLGAFVSLIIGLRYASKAMKMHQANSPFNPESEHFIQ